MCIFVKASLMMVIRVYYSWTGERRFGKREGKEEDTSFVILVLLDYFSSMQL